MNPEATEDQVMVRDGIRKFVEATSPIALRKSGTGTTGPELRRFWREAAAIGVTSLLVPVEYGGAGLGDPVSCLAVVAEEMGRQVAPGPLAVCNVVADALARSGSADQKSTWLPALASGEALATWALAEGRSWMPSGHTALARRDGDSWILSGTKSPVEAAGDADLVLVTARTDSGRLVQLLVDTGFPGVSIEPLSTLDLAHGWDAVRFDEVRLGPDTLLGDLDGALVAVEHQLDLALCVQASETAAMVQTVFELTVDYLGDRYAFGRVVASYQAIKHRLAEHKTWLEASLGVATALAAALDADDPSAARLASAAKVHAGDQAVTTLSDCSQLLGGISMTWDHDHHVFLRRGTVNLSTFGDPADHRERLCRLAGL